MLNQSVDSQLSLPERGAVEGPPPQIVVEDISQTTITEPKPPQGSLLASEAATTRGSAVVEGNIDKDESVYTEEDTTTTTNNEVTPTPLDSTITPSSPIGGLRATSTRVVSLQGAHGVRPSSTAPSEAVSPPPPTSSSNADTLSNSNHHQRESSATTVVVEVVDDGSKTPPPPAQPHHHYSDEFNNLRISTGASEDINNNNKGATEATGENTTTNAEEEDGPANPETTSPVTSSVAATAASPPTAPGALQVSDLPRAPWRTSLRNSFFPYASGGKTSRGLFEYVLVFCLVLVLIITAAFDYTDRQCLRARCQTLTVLEAVLTIVFILELLLHWIAFGAMKFAHPVRIIDAGSVIGNALVLLAYASGAVVVRPSLLVFRTPRVFRPLFTNTDFPSLRMFIVAMTQSVYQLTDVAILFSLLLFWFGAAGLSQMGGSLQKSCVHRSYFDGNLTNEVLLPDNFTSFEWGDPMLFRNCTSDILLAENGTTLNETSSCSGEEIYRWLSRGDYPIAITNDTSLFDYSITLYQPPQITATDDTTNHSSSTTTPTTTGIISNTSSAEGRKAAVERIIKYVSFLPHPAQFEYAKLWCNRTIRFRRSTIDAYKCGVYPLWASTMSMQLGDDNGDPHNTSSSNSSSSSLPARDYTWLTIRRELCEAWYIQIDQHQQQQPQSADNATDYDNSSSNSSSSSSTPVTPPPFQLPTLSFLVGDLGGAFTEDTCTPFRTCDNTPLGILTGYRCPYDYVCIDGGTNYLFGIVGYDSILPALLTNFITISFELWYDIMYLSADSNDFFVTLFFVLLVVVGGILITSLTTVIVTVEFERTKEEERRRLIEQQVQQGAVMDTFASVVMRLKNEMKRTETLLANRLANEEEEWSDIEVEGVIEIGPDGTPIQSPPRRERALSRKREKKASPTSSPKQAFVETKSRLTGMLDASAAHMKTFTQPLMDNTTSAVNSVRYDFFAKRIVRTSWFEIVSFTIIAINLVVLCAVHQDMTEEEQLAQETLNMIFAVAYSTEFALRVIASDSIRTFFKKYSTWTDACVVGGAWVDILVSTSSGANIPIISSFRSLRIMKIITLFPSLYVYIKLILSALKAAPMVTLVLFLVVFVFACLCMQVLGGYFCNLDYDYARTFDFGGPTLIRQWVPPSKDNSSSGDGSTELAMNVTSRTHTRQRTLTSRTPTMTPTLPTPSLTISSTTNSTSAPLSNATTTTSTANTTNTTTPATTTSPTTNHTNTTSAVVVLLPDGGEEECTGVPRMNFDGFGYAFLTSFVIATGDGWEFVMYDAIRVNGQWMIVAFCIYYYIVGFVLFPLIVGVLLSAKENEFVDEVADTEIRTQMSLSSMTGGGSGGSGGDGQPNKTGSSIASVFEEIKTGVRSNRNSIALVEPLSGGGRRRHAPSMSRASAQERVRAEMERRVRQQVLARGASQFDGMSLFISDSSSSSSSIFDDSDDDSDDLLIPMPTRQYSSPTLRSLPSSAHSTLPTPTIITTNADDEINVSTTPSADNNNNNTPSWRKNLFGGFRRVSDDMSEVEEGGEQITPVRQAGSPMTTLSTAFLSAQPPQLTPGGSRLNSRRGSMLSVGAAVSRTSSQTSNSRTPNLSRRGSSSHIRSGGGGGSQKITFRTWRRRTKRNISKKIATLIESINNTTTITNPRFIVMCGMAKRVTSSWAFGMCTEVLFVFGCATLTLRDPIAAPDATYTTTINTCESVFTALHLFEVLLRCMSDGVMFGEGSLIRQTGWGPFILCSAILSLTTLIVEVGTTMSMNHPFPMVLRVLRSTRPIRLVQYIPSCATVLYSLGASMAHMGRVMAICGLVLIICSIEGVRTFRGLLRSCLVPDYGFVDGIGLKECEEVYRGTWTSPGANFDNIGAAIMSVFTISTLEGWSDIMYDLMDSSSTYGDPMVLNNSPWGAVYAVIVVLLMALLVMNLFASVLIDAYNTVKREAAHQKTVVLERQEGAILLSQSRIFRCFSPQLQRQFLRDNPNVLGAVDFRLLSGLVPVSAVKSMQDFGKRVKKTMEELPGAVSSVVMSPTGKDGVPIKSILKKVSRLNGSPQQCNNRSSPSINPISANTITSNENRLNETASPMPEFQLDVDPPSISKMADDNDDEDEEELKSLGSSDRSMDLPPTPPSYNRSRSPSFSPVNGGSGGKSDEPGGGGATATTATDGSPQDGEDLSRKHRNASFTNVRQFLNQNAAESSSPEQQRPLPVVDTSSSPPPMHSKKKDKKEKRDKKRDSTKRTDKDRHAAAAASRVDSVVVSKTIAASSRRHSADPDIDLPVSRASSPLRTHANSTTQDAEDDGSRKLIFTLDPKLCRDKRLMALLRGDIDDGSDDDERTAPIVLNKALPTLFDVEPELATNLSTEVRREVNRDPTARLKGPKKVAKWQRRHDDNSNHEGTGAKFITSDEEEYDSSYGSSSDDESADNSVEEGGNAAATNFTNALSAFASVIPVDEDAAGDEGSMRRRKVQFEDEVEAAKKAAAAADGNDASGSGDPLGGTFKNISFSNITSKIADIATASNSGIKNLLSVQDETMDDYRTRARRIVRSNSVVNGSHLMVFASFVSMCWQTYPLSQIEEDSTFYLNIIFTSIFALEAVIKIFVETLPGYFSSKWNRLDFLVAVTSAGGTLLIRFYGSNSFALAQAFRLVRLVRLGDGRLEIRGLIGKMGKAMFGLLNITIVYGVTMYMFALVGMELFGRIKQGAYGVTSGIDAHTTFYRVDKGLIILLRAMTGGNWPDMMLGVGRFDGSGTAFCDPHLGNCGLPSPIPELYFLIFVTVSFFILRNLMMAILVDSFSGSAQNTAEKKGSAQELVKVWLQIDTDGLLKLRPTAILSFLRKMPKDSVLGFNHLPTMKRVSLELTCLTRLKLRDLHTPVSFGHLIDVLCTVAYPDVEELPPSRIFFFDPDKEDDDDDVDETGAKRPNIDPTTSEDVSGDSEFEIFAKRAAGVLIGYSLISIRRRRAAKLAAEGGGMSRSVSMSRGSQHSDQSTGRGYVPPPPIPTTTTTPTSAAPPSLPVKDVVA